MNKVGRKIYYEKSSGNVLLATSEMMGGVIDTTVEEDFQNYSVLSERVFETVGVLILPYGEYSQDFAECDSYRVIVETGELEFSYPVDGGETEPPVEPVFQPPLSEKVVELENRTTANEDMLLALMMGGM